MNALTHEQAAARMRAAGLEPLGAYPGRLTERWPARCTTATCGRTVNKSLKVVRDGWRCRHTDDVLTVPRPRLTREQAVAELTGYGFTPRARYPGTTHRPWPATCNDCGQPSRPTLSRLRTGARCRHCARTARRTPETQAVAEMRAAGFEPQEPFPGSVHAPWKVRCTTCCEVSWPRLHKIRHGGGCGPCRLINRKRKGS